MTSEYSRGLRVAADDVRYVLPNEQRKHSLLMYLDRGDMFDSTKVKVLRQLYNDMMMQLIGKDYADRDHEIWRVEIKPTYVSALFIGMEQRDEVRVTAVTDLPDWMQDRIAVLSMLTKSPTVAIKGVGRRISERVYWVVE